MTFSIIVKLISFLLLINLYSIFVQQPASANIPGVINLSDTTRKIIPAGRKDFIVKIRIVKESELDKYRADPDFNYDLNKNEAVDWITKIRNWINQQLARLRNSEVYAVVIDYLYYAIAILALVLILRGLIKADRSGLFFNKVSNNQLSLTAADENIDQLDFEGLISSAINSRHYKLAVRYLFLKSLKLLSDKQLIVVRNYKTNNQYLQEIKNEKIASAFKDASVMFEWIWYGDFPVDDAVLSLSRREFNNLFGLLAE